MEEEITKGWKNNPTLQMENNRTEKNANKNCKCICKNSMLKGEYENGITQKCLMFGLLFC